MQPGGCKSAERQELLAPSGVRFLTKKEPGVALVSLAYPWLLSLQPSGLLKVKYAARGLQERGAAGTPRTPPGAILDKKGTRGCARFTRLPLAIVLAALRAA